MFPSLLNHIKTCLKDYIQGRSLNLTLGSSYFHCFRSSLLSHPLWVTLYLMYLKSKSLIDGFSIVIGLTILPYVIETFPILSCSLKTRYENILTNYETSLVQICDLVDPLVLILCTQVWNIKFIRNSKQFFFLTTILQLKKLWLKTYKISILRAIYFSLTWVVNL